MWSNIWGFVTRNKKRIAGAAAALLGAWATGEWTGVWDKLLGG